MSADNSATILERTQRTMRRAHTPAQRPPRTARPAHPRPNPSDTQAGMHTLLWYVMPQIEPMIEPMEGDLTNPFVSQAPLAPVLPAVPLESGLLVEGRYRLEKNLLNTTMSSVWRARDLQTKQYVVIKFAKKTGNKAQEDTLIRALDNEGKIMMELPKVRDPNEDFPINFPTYIAQGWYGERRFLVMSYIEGTQLSALIEKGMPLHQSLEVAISLLYGLALMNRTGHIHRDIKAGNVILDRQGRVHLFDFGIAHLKGNRDASGFLVGSFSCMSPEQIVGATLDHRVDIYQLGILLYEMTTGSNPMRSWDNDLAINRQLYDSLPALTPEQVEGRFNCPDSRLQKQAADLRLQLDAIIQGMSEKMTDRRLGNITELIQRLGKLRDIAKELAPYETYCRPPGEAEEASGGGLRC